MSKKLNISKLKSGIKNALPNNNPQGVKDNSIKDTNIQLKRKYYDLQTDSPLSLKEIEDRIKRNFKSMDRISIEVMLDLYFIYCNWTTFYNRQDSFKKYLEKNIPVSKSYAYDIIRVVKMLIEYYKLKKQKKSDGSTLLLEQISFSLNKIGMKKLKYLSQVKDKADKIDLLNKLLDGENIEIENIIQQNKKMIKTINNSKANNKIELKGNQVFIDKKLIITFSNMDKKLIDKLYILIQNILAKERGNDKTTI